MSVQKNINTEELSAAIVNSKKYCKLCTCIVYYVVGREVVRTVLRNQK